VIYKKDSNIFIQFVAQGEWGIRMETISNYYRDDQNQLTKAQMDKLNNIGWNTPTNNPDQSTPKNDPDGSPNYFIDYDVPADYEAIAQITIKTFVDVLGISHPGMLEYEAFDRQGNSIPIPKLKLMRRIELTEDAARNVLEQQLLETVKELTDLNDLCYDEDGEICGIAYGSATVAIGLLEERPYCYIRCPVLTDTESTFALLSRINELNCENGHMHLVLENNCVKAISEVLVAPFVSSHIAHAIGNFCQIADEFVEKLQAEFGDAEAGHERIQKPKH
jgi:hypothetical protein